MQSRKPKLLDLVAVLQRPAHVDLEVGDVGTVVELLPPDGIEVEFLDRDGITYSFASPSVIGHDASDVLHGKSVGTA
jgi:hypothetical protein